MFIFSILGGVEVRKGERVIRLGGHMRQTLLAALLVSADTIVTVDSLIEELWGTTPPAKVENALQAQVSRLRRSLARLEPDRGRSRLTTSPSGYRMELEPSELDAWTFVETLDEIRDRADSSLLSDSDADVMRLREALSIWRGPVFGGLAGGPICQTAAAKYRESRNVALGLLYELELRAGRHAKVLPELTELFALHPLQEQFCTLLMLALYRAGRQIDALDVYRRFRRRLTEELGVEPSPTMCGYERAILLHDPILTSEQVGVRQVDVTSARN